MDLSKLAAKPQLMEIKIDDADTVEKYGESVSFWMLDRQDIETFVRMSKLDSQDFAQTSGLVKELILDKDGKKVLTEGGEQLPMDIQLKAITKVVEELGKLTSVLSKKVTEK